MIEGFGFGAILAVDDSLLPADLQAFFYEMHRLTVCDWIASPTKSAASTLQGMVAIQGGTFDFRVFGSRNRRRRLAGYGCPVSVGECTAAHHMHRLQISPFFID
jgi:hypothetical protein